MTSLHRVSTACSILVSHDSQSAKTNPNRTDNAGKSKKMRQRQSQRQRQLKSKKMNKARANFQN